MTVLVSEHKENDLVTALGGTSLDSAADDYTFVDPPTVTALVSNSGSMAGGNAVVISGSNFVGVTAVRFGTVDAASFTVDSATQITAVAPAHPAGLVNVQVTALGGTSLDSAADDYGYVSVALRIVSMLCNPSLEAPATREYVVFTVLVPGSLRAYTVRDEANTVYTFPNRVFQAGDAFRLNTGPGTDSQTELFWGRGTTASVWNNTGGDTVFVHDPEAHLVASRAYSSPPTVTSLTPSSGTTAGGTSVVVRGTNFVGATALRFGTVDAASFTVDSATQITAVAPAQAAGSVYVRVTTTDGWLISTGAAYTYLAAP